jgi:AcrR family transcriptional regulator
MTVKLRRAADAFATVGYEAARMGDLEKVTGIPTSTIYYYFGGKQDLLAFLLRDYLDGLATAVTEAVEAALDPRARLRAVIETLVRVMYENPSTCQILLSELGRVGRLPAVAAAVREAVHQPLQVVLDEGVADGTFAAEDTETTTSMIYGAVTMAVLHHLVAGPPVEPADLAAQLTRQLASGVELAPVKVRARRAG